MKVFFALFALLASLSFAGSARAAAAACAPLLASVPASGKPDKETTKILQNFLRRFEDNAALPENGTYGNQTAAAVSAFQKKYADEILKPSGLKFPTGLVGKRTVAKINELYCAEKPEVEKKEYKIKQSSYDEIAAAAEARRLRLEKASEEAFAKLFNAKIEVPLSVTKACFAANAEPGQKSAAVKAIQKFLQEAGHLDPKINANGLYGPATTKAVEKFQAAYADEILKPAGLKKPTGKWLGKTRAKANEIAGCSL